jgi:DNA-binding NtrC family response regulator
MRNKKKILIADDDADIRLGYEVLLTANHYETFFASDALSTVIDAHTTQARSDYSRSWSARRAEV